MRTHREKHLSTIGDKELINFFYTHLDRATDRNSGALNNHFITTFPTLSEKEKQEKWSAVQGYLIQQNEDLSALRLSLKETHKRFLKNKRQLHNMKVQFEKIRGERAPEIDDVKMPDLWNVSGIILEEKKP